MAHHTNMSSKSLENEYLLLQDIFMKGDQTQKLGVIRALPQLLQYDNNAVFARILTKIQQELPKSSCEFHIATSKVFAVLMQRQLHTDLMKIVLEGIESKDLIISNIWIKTLLDIIPVLSEEQIRKEVIGLVVIKSQLNNSVYWRINSCKILGKVAVHPCIGSLDVKSNILPLVQSLCQDCIEDVRAAMCSQLHLIVQSLNDNLIKSGLLPCLVELASDENTCVRSSAVATVVQIIPYLTKQTKIDTIIPLVKQLCDKAIEVRDITLLTIAREFGTLVNSLHGAVDINSSLWFLKFYETLTKSGYTVSSKEMILEEGVIYRQECACNLPAVAFFTTSQIFPNLKLWHSIFRGLANDSSDVVRKSVASCIHDIINILGPNSKVITQDIVNLLYDDSEDVLQMLLPHLSTSLKTLCAYNILLKDELLPLTLQITRAILKCHKQIFKSYNWRIQVCFLCELECLPDCMPSSFIFQHFPPIILDIIIEARAKPVKFQASKTLLIILKYSTKEVERKWIRQQILTRLYNAKSCYVRQIYIKMCFYAMDIFSYKYFKQHFFSHLLSLIEDPISNIRLSVVKLLPHLKLMCTSNSDRELERRIHNMLIKMENSEKDKDVKDMLIYYKTKLNESLKSCDSTKYLIGEQEKGDRKPSIYQEKAVLCETSISESQMSLSLQKPIITQLELPLPNNQSNQSCDMRFLEKHFYIDAGIILPCDNTPKTETINQEEITTKSLFTTDISSENLSTMSLVSLENHEISTANITDDVKVNLRNLNEKKCMNKLISLKSVIKENDNVKRSKRYSNVFPVENANFSSRNINNRRSLNLGVVNDLSKIPIFLKKSKSYVDMKVDLSNLDVNKIEGDKNRNNILRHVNGNYNNEEELLKNCRIVKTLLNKDIKNNITEKSKKIVENV